MSPTFNLSLVWPWFQSLLPWMAAFLLILLINLFTGIFLALRLKCFDWERVPEFLLNGCLFFWAWMTCELLAFLPLFLGIEIPTYAESLADVGPKAIFVLIIVGKYVGSIVANIKQILALKDPKPWQPDELATNGQDVH